MNELLAEWIAKAEGDYATAERELHARKRLNHDAVCFHAQQMAEKYLKAFLFQNGVDFPKIHNLIELLQLGLPLDPSLNMHRELFDRLEDCAVQFRYPGLSEDRDEARLAFQTARRIRAIPRQKLGLHD
jgi:HEPN domain-containing protein